MKEVLNRNYPLIWTIAAVVISNFASYKATVARYDEILNRYGKDIVQLQTDRDALRLVIEKINNDGTVRARTEWANALVGLERMDKRITSIEEYIYRTLGPTIQRIDATVNKAKKPTSNSPDDE